MKGTRQNAVQTVPHRTRSCWNDLLTSLEHETSLRIFDQTEMTSGLTREIFFSRSSYTSSLSKNQSAPSKTLKYHFKLGRGRWSHPEGHLELARLSRTPRYWLMGARGPTRSLSHMLFLSSPVTPTVL